MDVKTSGERIKHADLDAAAVGKTIAAAEFRDAQITIRFADGTWACVMYWADREGDVSPLDPDPIDCGLTLEALGILPPGGRRALIDARNARLRAEAEARDRYEYERLKAKYEGEADA